MSDRRRILIFESAAVPPVELPPLPGWEAVRVHNVAEGLALLRADSFDGVFLRTDDNALWQRASTLLQADYILQVLGDGVALVNLSHSITWANATFEKWCGGPAKGKPFYEALGSPEILGPDYCPFHTALAGKPVTTRLHRTVDNRYLELTVTPIADTTGKVSQLLSLARDVTAEVHRQQQLDALHRAGNELSTLDPKQLAEMSVEERIELLKYNIRRFTHDVLHYSVIEVRMLDKQTGRLEPLLQEGMTLEAAQRVLYARAEGNGVTGFVAATGKSYLCQDTATDPLYIEGAPGARSSLTVALAIGDEVIGTFNVESVQPNAFGEQDVQFAEIFSREIAAALHTLDLLSAERLSTATQSIEVVSREVALPVDEILAEAASMLERWIGHDPAMVEKLRHILASARSIKQCIQKVGEKLALPEAAPAASADPRLKGLRVLVADNDERVRRSAHNLLGRVGCVVETARDGKEALTMARLSNYDVILADIRLPDMPGYDAYQGLRQAQPQARVILMTAYGYDPSHAIVKARQDGLRCVLFKPFRVDQLLTALNTPETAERHAEPQPAPV